MDVTLEFRQFHTWEHLMLIQLNIGKVSKEQHTWVFMNYLNLAKWI